MSFGSGASAKVYVSGYDLTAYFASLGFTNAQGAYDVTTFGATGKAFIPGLTDGQITADGFFDGGADLVDQVLSAAIGAASDGQWLVFLAGAAIGARGRGCASVESNYQVSNPVDGAVTVSAAVQSDGGLDGVVSLHALGAETTSPVNSASVNNAAGSTNGGVAFIQATAFTGTSVVIKIQHSTDDAVWADLVTFTAIDAARDYERVLVAAGTTVNQYLRSQVASGTFTSVTFVSGFARR